MAQQKQDHTKGKVKGPGTGWKDRQKAAGGRRDAQLSALTQMIRGLAGDCLRLSMKCKILEDVLAKECGVTREDFDASTAAVTATMTPVNQPEAAGDQVPAPADTVAPDQTPVVVEEPVATGDAIAAV